MNRSRYRWLAVAAGVFLVAVASTVAFVDRPSLPATPPMPVAVPAAGPVGPAHRGRSTASPPRKLLMTDWDTQVAHVPELRRLADAGVPSAAWRMADFVARCESRPPETEAETQQRLDGMRREREEDDRGVAPDDWAAVVEMITKSARQDRQMCADLEPADLERQLGWLEFALAGNEPELFMRMTQGGFPFPDDQARMIRHAEKLASFVERAKVAFDARIEGGDVALLRRAEFYFYTGADFWPRGGDYYRARVHASAARMLPDDGSGIRPGHELDRYLTPDEIQAADAEGRALYARCCAGR